MDGIRRAGWVGFAVGVLALSTGGALTVGSAIAAGDWWLARQPWIGTGLTLLVVGLATTGVSVLVLDIVEPIGRWRLLAVPPGLIVGFLWAFWLLVGLPTTGPGAGPERDVRTILYSVPEMLVAVLGATILMALPLALGSRGVRNGTRPR